MTSEEFLSSFIDNCIEKGQTSPTAMCNEAQKEIDLIEEELKKIEALRMRQSSLRQIIRQFSGAEPAKRAKKAPMITDLSKDSLDPQIRDICIKVCELVESKAPTKLTPYQIRDAVVSLENHMVAYAAIKSLWDRGVIQRLDEGPSVLISKGPKWNERPTKETV